MKKTKFINVISDIWSSSKIGNFLVILFFALIFTIVLSVKYFLFQTIISPDGVSKKDVIATKTIEVTDVFKTEQQRKEVIQRIAPILTPAEDAYIKSNLSILEKSVWEIKGLLSRLIYYQLYQLTSIFTSAYYPTGHYIFTAIGLIELTIIIGFSIILIPSQYMKTSAKLVSFFVSTIAIFISSGSSNMQPELWGYSLLLLSFCILLRENIADKIIGGIFLGFVFFIKTPYLLLAGSIFFAYALVTNRSFKQTIQNIWIYASSALLTICTILILLFFTYPIEIHDIFVLPRFYGNLFSLSPVTMLQALGNGFTHIIEIPLHIPIVLAGAISACMYLTFHKIKENIMMLLMWLFPYLYIVISNYYFVYHYNTMLFPAVVTIYLSNEQWKRLSWKHCIIISLCGLVIGIICSRASVYVLFTILLSYIIAIPYLLMALSLVEKWQKHSLYATTFFIAFLFTSLHSGFSYASMYSKNEVEKMVQSNLEKGYPIGGCMGKGEILHLTDGSTELWVGNKSYLRYFYPLPLLSPSYMTSEEGFELENLIRQYDGEILTLGGDYERYLRKNAQKIIEHIEERYYPCDTIYQVYTVFTLYKKCPIVCENIVIYHRKEKNER